MFKPFLITFDFDNTIINENSDGIIRNMYPHELTENVKNMYYTTGWTAYMRSIFQLVHSIGIKEKQIIDAVNAIPSVSGIEDLIKKLHSHNCDVIIISDANSVFIENWLKNRGLSVMVNKIFTNPSWFDENDLLNVKEYHDQDWCNLSEKNLCKGYVLEEYIKQKADEGVQYNKVAFIGDGENDFCPMLKLSENDIAFPRQDYHIMKAIDKHKDSDKVIKAAVVPWKDGNDIWKTLKAHLH